MEKDKIHHVSDLVCLDYILKKQISKDSAFK